MLIQNLNKPEIRWDTGAKDTLNTNFYLDRSVIIKRLTIAADDRILNKVNSGFEFWLFKNVFALGMGIKKRFNK